MIDQLNTHLALELAASVRYSGHAKIIAYHGYSKLAAKYEEEASEELSHANKLIRRIQQLGGFPEYLPNLPGKPLTAWNIKTLLTSDLSTERTVLASLKALSTEADDTSDYETYRVLLELTGDTADHIQWLETQLAQLDEIGLSAYLQAQM